MGKILADIAEAIAEVQAKSVVVNPRLFVVLGWAKEEELLELRPKGRAGTHVAMLYGYPVLHSRYDEGFYVVSEDDICLALAKEKEK